MEPSPVVIAALTKANIDKNSLSFLGSDEKVIVLLYFTVIGKTLSNMYSRNLEKGEIISVNL